MSIYSWGWGRSSVYKLTGYLSIFTSNIIGDLIAIPFSYVFSKNEPLSSTQIDVCPGVIYPKAPITPGLKDLIENYLNDYALQVVWYDDTE